MNRRDLTFFLRFRSDAQRALRGVQQGLRGVGRAASRGGRSLQGFARRLQAAGASAARLGARLRTVGTSIQEAGRTLAVFSAAAVAAFGAAARESIRFEQAFVGVQKTTNLTDKEIRAFSERISELSDTLPVSADELLRLAQLAGQLGIEGGDNLARFAVTVAKTAESTDLASEAATFALARLLALTEEPTSEVKRLASQFVALGNNVKATESQIASVARELGVALGPIGRSSTEITVLAASLAEIGLPPRRTRTALRQFFTTIEVGAQQGGAELQVLSRLADRTPAAFQELVRLRGPFQASIEVLRGFRDELQQSTSRASKAEQILEALGLSSEGVASVLPALADRVGDLEKNLALANAELENATALDTEFGRFASILLSRLKTVGGQFQNTLRIIGDAFRPELERLIGLLRNASGAFRRFGRELERNEGLRETVVQIGFFVGVIGPAVLALGSFVRVLGFALQPFGLLVGLAAQAALVIGGPLVNGILRLTAAIRAVGITALLTNPIGLALAAVVGLTAGILALSGESVSLGNVLRETGNGVVRVFQFLGTTIGFVFSVAFTIVRNFAARVVAEFSRVGSFLDRIFARDVRGAFAALTEPVEAPGIFDGVLAQAEGFGRDLSRIFGAQSDPLGDAATAVGNAVGVDLGDGVLGGLQEKIAAIKAALRPLETEIPEASSPDEAAVEEFVVKPFQRAGGEAGKQFGEAFATATDDVFERVGMGVADLILDTQTSFRDFLRSLTEDIARSGIQNFVRGLGQVATGQAAEGGILQALATGRAPDPGTGEPGTTQPRTPGGLGGALGTIIGAFAGQGGGEEQMRQQADVIVQGLNLQTDQITQRLVQQSDAVERLRQSNESVFSRVGSSISSAVTSLGSFFTGGGAEANPIASALSIAAGVAGAASGGLGGGLSGGGAIAAPGGGFVAGGLFGSGGLADRPKRRALVPVEAFARALRFQTGGVVGSGSDTIPALLSPGEMVLTPRQQRQVAVGMAGAREERPVQINFNISTPDAQSFQRSQDQIFARAARALQRADSRDN